MGFRNRLACFAGLALCLLQLVSATSWAEPFTVGNLLVTHDNTLYEYTLDGTLVQFVAVPHLGRGNFVAGDVAFDRFGRAHVVNFAPFSENYISTYDPASAAWTHTPAPVAFSGSADADLSILGDKLFRRGVRMDVTTLVVETFDIGMFNGPSETSVGFDGLLYSINSGSPRFRMQRTDPVSLLNIGEEFEVLDSNGDRLFGRGLAATTNGEIYVADFDGRIYHFDSNANYIDELPTGAENLDDLNLRSDGLLATGGRFGDVVITNVGFSTLSTFNVGDNEVYVAFVSFPVPEPSSFLCALVGGLALALFGGLKYSRRSMA